MKIVEEFQQMRQETVHLVERLPGESLRVPLRKMPGLTGRY